MSTIKHVAGSFRDNMQECILCGEILCDYTHAMFSPGSPIPKGWAVGEVYISGTNPKYFSVNRPENEIIIDCTK